MTHIEQAIKNAVEKGEYELSQFETDWYQWIQDDQINHLPTNGIFLDPAFWQALGKARGWSDTYHADWKGDYKYHWHRFIDHLAEGKDAESFFKDL